MNMLMLAAYARGVGTCAQGSLGVGSGIDINRGSRGKRWKGRAKQTGQKLQPIIDNNLRVSL